MPGLDFDAAIYVKHPPEIVLDEGHFHICYTIGRVRIEFVMRPSIFLKSLRNGNRAADEFHASKGGVVGFKR